MLPTPWSLRRHQADDIAWAIQRQVDLYAQERGYLPVFGDYVRESFAPFVGHFDPSRDALWVAESGGRRVGCVGIQHDRQRPGWAKFRWYFVDTPMRGQGVGRALIDAAVEFAREAGYQGIWLLTVDDLADARKQYERHGFQLVHTEAAPCEWAPWGHEQTWELHLV